jgi:hypothetical protein
MAGRCIVENKTIGRAALSQPQNDKNTLLSVRYCGERGPPLRDPRALTSCSQPFQMQLYAPFFAV